jgi:hypothetical protein
MDKTTPNVTTKTRQTSQQKRAKLPNEKTPNYLMKNRQIT